THDQSIPLPWPACRVATASLSRCRWCARAPAKAGIKRCGARRNYDASGIRSATAATRLRVCIAVARDTLELSPRLAIGMTVGAKVPTTDPAVVGAVRIGTEMLSGIDPALAAPCESEDRLSDSNRENMEHVRYDMRILCAAPMETHPGYGWAQ